MPKYLRDTAIAAVFCCVGMFIAYRHLAAERDELRRAASAAQANASQAFPVGSAKNPYVLPLITHTRDGDTFVAPFRSSRPTPTGVRLLGCNTPERGEPGYEEAATALRNKLSQGIVAIYFEPPDYLERRDSFGRLLCWVTVNGELVNAAMVREGLAKVDRHPCSKTAELQLLESAAKQAKRGIWRD